MYLYFNNFSFPLLGLNISSTQTFIDFSIFDSDLFYMKKKYYIDERKKFKQKKIEYCIFHYFNMNTYKGIKNILYILCKNNKKNIY